MKVQRKQKSSKIAIENGKTIWRTSSWPIRCASSRSFLLNLRPRVEYIFTITGVVSCRIKTTPVFSMNSTVTQNTYWPIILHTFHGGHKCSYGSTYCTRSTVTRDAQRTTCIPHRRQSSASARTHADDSTHYTAAHKDNARYLMQGLLHH